MANQFDFAKLPDALYVKIFEAMLERHFGLQLADTGWSEEGLSGGWRRTERIYELLNAMAVRYDLVRIDVADRFGASLFVPLTAAEEDRVVAKLLCSA